MLLVDLNYNFECDWFVELSDNKLSDNKLSDNNLGSELVGNRSFFKPITIEEIVVFMITIIITLKGNEKINTEKMTTKQSEEYFFHQRYKEMSTNTVMASRF